MLKSFALPSFINFASASRPVSVLKRRAVLPARAVWRQAAAIGLVGLNILLLLSYLIAVNSYASTGYEIKTLQNRLSQLTEESKTMTIKVSEISSMVGVQNDFLSANFVPAGTPQFLQSNQLSQR